MSQQSAKFRPFSVGRRGLDRVRVYYDRHGQVLAEWREPQPDGGPSKKRRRKLHVTTKADAEREAEEISRLLRLVRSTRPEEQGDPGTVGPAELEPASSGEITVGELFDIYLVERTPEKAETSQAYDRSCLAMWRAFLGENRPAMDVGREDWYAFAKKRRAGTVYPGKEPRGKPGPRTVQRDQQLLRAVYNWAVDPDTGRRPLLDASPLNGLRLPKQRHPNRPQISREAAQRLIKAAQEVAWRLWVALVLAHETGHRMGSIRRLAWEDIRFETGEVQWRHELDKEGNPHRTPLSSDAVTALRFAEQKRPDGSPWVLPAPESPQQPVRKDTMKNWLRKAERLAGLPRTRGFGFHAFRRKLVNELRERVSVPQIAQLGGWTSTETVVKVYMASDPDELRSVLDLRPGLGLEAAGPEPGDPSPTDSKTDSNSGEGAGGPESDPPQDTGGQ